MRVRYWHAFEARLPVKKYVTLQCKNLLTIKEGGQALLFTITIKRASSNGRCHYDQRERVKRELVPFVDARFIDVGNNPLKYVRLSIDRMMRGT